MLIEAEETLFLLLNRELESFGTIDTHNKASLHFNLWIVDQVGGVSAYHHHGAHDAEVAITLANWILVSLNEV